jgi:hypothetical protein
MRFVAIAAFMVACSPSVDPKVEESVVALEKFAAEAKAGDCAALKTAFDAAHASEGLKAVVEASPLEARVKAADEKVKPLFEACAAEEAKKAAEAAAAPAETPAVEGAAPVAEEPAEEPAKK